MSRFYRHFVRPLLFLQDSETAHHRALSALSFVSRHPAALDLLAHYCQPNPLPLRLWNLDFPNPVGLAAGMDKQAQALPAWEAIGFGFAELGGVTRHAQPGNPLPRMFRVIPDRALINRMGFNNPGAEAFAASLRDWRARRLWPRHPVGVNLGKSKITPLDQAPQDYAFSLEQLRREADFFVVNVSSPNTSGLRRLQDKGALAEILSALRQAQTRTGDDTQPKPVLIKVAPDLTWQALDDILTLVEPHAVAGIVATNTTLARPESPHTNCRSIYQQDGGLSGQPLRQRSTDIIRHLYRQTKGALPIIGVGGIFNADDAWEKIVAGASLVQVYTGLVYEGPRIVHDIVEGLRHKLRAHNLPDIAAAVGIGSNADL